MSPKILHPVCLTCLTSVPALPLLPFIEHLLYDRHSVNHFPFTISFNSYHKSGRKAFPHPNEEQTKSQGGIATCSRSHSCEEAEAGFKPGPSDPADDARIQARPQMIHRGLLFSGGLGAPHISKGHIPHIQLPRTQMKSRKQAPTGSEQPKVITPKSTRGIASSL